MYDSVPQDAILNKAFQLAYFIHGNKVTALKVVISSLERLETAVAAQDRRLYYTPSSTQASLRDRRNGFRYKVSLNESHLLQRLIYLMSEPFEIERELSDSAPCIEEEDMIIHYLKHLVHITVRRNSFYLTLGISRLLHNYTTGETLDIYTAVGQPDRISDDDYFRSRKRLLMQEIKKRFGSLVGICKGPRSEERFITQDCSDRKARLVEYCLELFVPWNTPCLITETPTDGNVSGFKLRHRDPDAEHTVEVDRFHTLIHPHCYRNLIQGLGLDRPFSRLQIPYFFLSKGGNGTDAKPPSTRGNLPSLDEQDLDAIRRHMDESSSRRRTASRGLLKIRADGTERAQLDLKRSSTARICLQDGENMIEVTTDDGRGELVLATHLITFDETRSEVTPSQLSIVLEGGQKLSFDISHLNGPADGDGAITVNITYSETNPIRAVALFLNRRWRQMLDALGRPWQRSPVAIKLAIVCGAIIAIAVVASLTLQWAKLPADQPRTENLDEPASSSEQEIAPSPQQQQPPGTQRPNQLQVSEPSPKRSAVERPDNSRASNQSIARNFSHGVAPQTAPGEYEPARGPRNEFDPASLLEVRKICVQIGGKEQLSQQVQALLSDRLRATDRFTLTGIESADACLKILVKRLRASEKSEPVRAHKGTPDEKASPMSRLSITVRLVNADGRVIWPITGSTRKYSGSAEQAVAKAINDLIEDVEKIEGSRK
jgi:hypothetical protein